MVEKKQVVVGQASVLSCAVVHASLGVMYVAPLPYVYEFTLAASSAMVMRLRQSSCCAKTASAAAFLRTSFKEPRAQNCVTMHMGLKQRPISMATFGLSYVHSESQFKRAK